MAEMNYFFSRRITFCVYLIIILNRINAISIVAFNTHFINMIIVFI